ncbi:hypothetical protein [Brevundimonas sp. M20]|uniref:hypothetical protein n=1 Tax=Brevundimonas sp. M20 TaxID=2591463 RepID=UPI0011475370|nr:hypothetical protein [Brevundimonas sp. M20]QDH72277.1 hypothetical protein FKQ52_01860 [Brevundimonas sp. M20]
MRKLIAFTPVVLGLALTACATAPGADRYNTELQQLADSCRERGGILSPTGQQSGRPQQDNICEIRGGTVRAPSPSH